MTASVGIATVECAHCHGNVEENAALRLFDGRWYCRGCVERESPALAEYAATHDYLDDQITYDLKALGLAAVFYSFVLVILSCVFLEFMPPIPGMSTLILVVMMILVPGPIMFFLFWIVAQVRFPRTIVADDGCLNVFTQLQAKQHRLHDCEWRVERCALGHITDGITLRAQLLVIYVPGWRRKQALAACQNDHSRELWIHFLKLSGVPEHR